MNTHKIVILDDDSTTNLLTSMILDDMGLTNQYHIMDNGWRALEYLESCQKNNEFPGYILVDLKMPVMDGFEFLSYYEQRFWKSNSCTKVLVLTSSVSERDRTRVMEFKSVSNLLNKPLTEEMINKSILKAER